ncbi:hypothetical protein ETH_00033545, partial [Eimeria tenella]
ALTLQLPSTEVLAQEMSPVDPEALQAAVRSARKELFEAFSEELHALYKQLTLPEAAAGEAAAAEGLDAANVARRRLRNVLLRLLAAPGDAAAAALAYKHYSSSKCMTDTYAALLVLADMQQPQRQQAFDHFYEQAKGDPLLVDKWFRAQAGSDLPDQVERVAALQQHEAFTIKNPNRLRALLSAFVFNRPHFHRKDGKGYQIIADAVLK